LGEAPGAFGAGGFFVGYAIFRNFQLTAELVIPLEATRAHELQFIYVVQLAPQRHEETPGDDWRRGRSPHIVGP